VSLIVLAKSLADDAERLAWVAANDAIHDSTPRAAVEGSEVRPDRCRIQGFLFHASSQDRGGERFPLNVADCASRSACCEVKSEVESAVPGTEGQHVDGR
jgi:hypothetical protein